ncbi:MAG: hypothetical protein PVF83_18830 [Anaerolineales bacterium]|jgi:hypothetical protein
MAKAGFQTRCDLHIVGPDIREEDVEMVITRDTDDIVIFTLYTSVIKGSEEIYSVAMNDVYFTDMSITPSKKGLGKKSYDYLVQVTNPSNEPEDPYVKILEEERERVLDFSFTSETEAYRTQKTLFRTQDTVHSTMLEALLDTLLRECETAGKLDFNEFARANIKTERIIHRNHEITVPMMVEHIETIVSDFITENILNGRVDKDTYIGTD